MPNPNKVFRKNLNQKDFNLLFFTNLVIAFLGSIFLAWKKVDAGFIYAIMFLGTIAIIVLVNLFLSDDNSLKPISNYIRIPIASKNTLALFFYTTGFTLPILLNIILRIAKSAFSVVSLSIPLFGADIATGSQSFATAQIGESMSWKIFSIMFVAGNMETFTYNFGMVLFGVLIAILILRLINEEKDIGFIPRRWFVLFIAFMISVGVFMISHTLNSTYAGIAFIVAGIFLLISNLSIYNAGVFLLFWAGWHQSNNLLYLIGVYGLKSVLAGFISWFGLIYLGYWILILFFLIRKWPQVVKDLGTWANY